MENPSLQSSFSNPSLRLGNARKRNLSKDEKRIKILTAQASYSAPDVWKASPGRKCYVDWVFEVKMANDSPRREN